MKIPFFLQGGLKITGEEIPTEGMEITSEAAYTQTYYWDLFWDGGWYIMAPLLIMLIWAVYIFFERSIAINKAAKSQKGFMDQIKVLVVGGKLDAAQTLCGTTTTPIAQLMGKGISRIGKPLKDIASAIENEGKLEIYKLEKGLSTLATIAGAAPMIGFLGTVIGMMATFQTMSVEGVELSSLSGGIMQAMVTTLAGLVIGIIAYVAYNMLVSRVESVIHKMEASSVEFLDILSAPGN